MTIGVGTYFPNGQFSVQRSYAYAVAFDGLFLPLVNPGPDFVFTPAADPTQHFFISFLPQFWEWSSNSYTLDHIIVASYFTAPPTFTPTPYNFRLRWLPGTATTPPAVEFFPTGSDTPPAFYALPDQPPGYWLPPL